MIVTTALLGALFAPSPAPPGPRAEALAPAAVSAAAQAEPIARTSVGMRVRIEEQPIPGPRLQAKPVADPGRADAIVRVLNVFPHGSGWRYNLEVTPLVEGTLDLGVLLEPAEAGATWDAPILEILSAAPVAEAVASLRADEEAGPLLLQLEHWLHRPGSEADTVDLGALLAPYRGTPDPGGQRG